MDDCFYGIVMTCGEHQEHHDTTQSDRNQDEATKRDKEIHEKIHERRKQEDERELR
jgi:hypothetical protein